ncbi:MAG: hypothetical protein RLZZ312_618 [Bacteroidota bacterium]|jgi:DNA repair protein RecO (recombination protein O)
MHIKTKAIVLSAIKYQEKSLIVKCFTASDGLKTYFVRDAFSSKKQNQKIAYFQPLSILDVEATHKNNGGLQYFKEIRIAVPFASVHTNLYKSTMAMFLAEILQYSIHEEEQNEDLFQYIVASLQWLDAHDDIANFHLIFILELTKFLGFYPDVSEIENQIFDWRDGVFVNYQTVTSLTLHETFLFKKLLDLSFDNTDKTFGVAERQILLKTLTNYLAAHLSGFKTPKSLEVLKEVFG